MNDPAERLRRQIAFIIEADKLKEIFRQTIVTQSRRAENSAEHSWHFALMVIVLAEHSNHQPLDVLRILQMVLIHDLVEIDAGDTFAYDTKNMADQHEREAKAATRIFGLLPADQAAEFRALWDEFEETHDARGEVRRRLRPLPPHAAQLPHRGPCLAEARRHPRPRPRPQRPRRRRLARASGNTRCA
jgi:5'-deoxynucleotidase YfbR-like HD superfamily hydrolase